MSLSTGFIGSFSNLPLPIENPAYFGFRLCKI